MPSLDTFADTPSSTVPNHITAGHISRGLMTTYQQQRPSRPQRHGSGRAGAKPPQDLQSMVGNHSARDMQDHARTGAGDEEKQGDIWGWLHESTGWSWTESMSDWWDSLWGADAELDTPAPVIEGPNPHVDTVGDSTVSDPSEVQDFPESGFLDPQIDRTDSATVGLKGAVISGGSKVEIRSGPGADASVTDRVADGKPVEIVEVSGSWIKVEYRVFGDKEEQGWVELAVFSDQPGLFMDSDHEGMMEDHLWQLHDREQLLPEAGELRGSDIKQGGLADCYFIAAMIAVGNARPAFLEESFRYNESTGLYEVRFFEEAGYNYRERTSHYKEVWVEVDGYLPTDGDRTAYARANPALWGALMEKAYAKWQGGFDVMGDGGYGSEAMSQLSGVASDSKSPSQMSAEEVLQFFTEAQAEGRAIYAGTQSSWESDTQTPLSGTAQGPYSGTVTQIHSWNEIKPGTLSIQDVGSGQAGSARDTGTENSKTASIVGEGVSEGEVDYSEPGSLSVTYKEGQTPDKAKDLEVDFHFKGMIAPQYQLVGWHGYAFKEIVDGKLQFHNPWGSWQPKAITPEDFTKYFSSCSTNLVPQAKAAQETSD